MPEKLRWYLELTDGNLENNALAIEYWDPQRSAVFRVSETVRVELLKNHELQAH